MSFLRTTDEKPITPIGSLMVALYLLVGMLTIRACAPFPPQVEAGK